MADKHTPGPLRASFTKISDVIAENGALVAKCNNLTGLVNLQANARLFAAAPDLLNELRAAHQIIRNALNLMTLDQKLEWASANEAGDVSGEGATRANEREAAIKKATGEQS